MERFHHAYAYFNHQLRRAIKYSLRATGPRKPAEYSLVRDDLEFQLWGPYSSRCIEDCERLQLDTGMPRHQLQAAWALARRYFENGDYRASLSNLAIARKLAPDNLQIALLSAAVLQKLGRTPDAATVANDAVRKYPDNPNAWYLAASLSSDHLALLNRPFRAVGLAPLRPLRPSEPLTLGNLTADAAPDPQSNAAKVSVIMPAFNCEDTLLTAARSVLAQSWTNLELVVVDDGSTDASYEIALQLARADARVVPVRMDRNAGAYAARNRGLSIAKGDFVTVNDADDWAHPQKLSVQMHDLLRSPDAINTSYGVRVLSDLSPFINSRSGRCIVENTSSLLVRTRHVRDLGGWDLVNFAADSELYDRLKLHLNVRSRRINQRTVLSFILCRPASLTRDSSTGLSSLFYGARREYKEAAAYWRSTTSTLKIAGETRSFPVPAIACSRDKHVWVDTLFVSDFSDPALLQTNLRQARILIESAEAFAVWHRPAYENAARAIDTEMRKLIHERNINVVVPGQTVHCRTQVIATDDPPYDFERKPDIVFRERVALSSHGDLRIQDYAASA